MKTKSIIRIAATAITVLFVLASCMDFVGDDIKNALNGAQGGGSVDGGGATTGGQPGGGQQTPEAPKEVTLAFDIDGNATTLTGKAGENLAPPETPAKTGYVFAGWNPALPETFPNEDTTYTATWRLEGDWSITYNLDGGTNADGNPSGYNIETPTIMLAAPTKTGYIFGGWYTTETFDEGTETTQIPQGTTGDVTLWAKWETDLLCNKFINGATFTKTDEVTVVPAGTTATVHMTDDSAWSGYVASSASDYYKGVFIKGRAVTLSPFAMGKYEVTQELYKAVLENDTECNATPSSFSSSPAGGETQEKRPVERVTWYDAVYFCNALTKLTMSEADCVYTITGITRDSSGKYITSATVTQDLKKKGYRLPTEAEWEFSARGGDPTKPEWKWSYAGSNTGKAPANFTSSPYNDDVLEAYAWYSSNSGSKTHEVGTKKANTLGIYDMSGNVWEWCWDWYNSTVDTAAATNPAGPASGSGRLGRGGGWYINAYDCAVSRRDFNSPRDRGNFLGFRLARSL